MMKYLTIYAVAITAFAMFFVFSSSTKNEQEGPTKEKTETQVQYQVIQAVKVPSSADLAGEAVPLDRFDVKERLDRELHKNTYWHSNTIQCIKRSHRYFPIIEPLLQEHGVPDDFKYLAVAESALSNATSPAGAKGVWQFMSPTAKAYGLVITDEVDERYHIEKATVAACKHLKELKNKLGSWTLAAAAYNMGTPQLKKNMDSQKETDYYNLNLNNETSRYVFRIIALKAIIGNPSEFGFFLESDDYYQPLTDFGLVAVDSPIASLGDFAHQYGTDYRTLKIYNPWLTKNYLKVTSGKNYKIKIPRN